MSDLRAYILCRFANKSGVYTSWLDQSPLPVTVVDEYLPDWNVPDDCGILITHMHYRWEELSTLRKLHEQNRIPILILSDGIIEYRNTWEHPDLVEGSIFQPLFGHKLACIGRGQARVVESWGNAGRCEVVGLPRFDDVGQTEVAPPNQSGPFRLLIATATTPAFTDQQRQTVVDSIEYLRGWLDENPTVICKSADGKPVERPIEVTWRLSEGFDLNDSADVSVIEDPDADQETRIPLGEVLDHVDAVITTPSTIYLESVLRKRPTAVLDFHNSPKYFSAAWTISAEGQLDSIVAELAAPAPRKMMFQEFVLQDQLECQTSAKPRMLRLIETMVEAGKVARANHQPIELPHRILDDPLNGFAAVPADFDLSSLYANHEAFQDQELDRLRVELAAAIKRLGQLPCELAEKNRYIAKLMATLDRSRDRVEAMHNRVVAIRKRFGVEPAKPKVDGRDVIDD